MTANSFSSVSLDPPMLLVCVANEAKALLTKMVNLAKYKDKLFDRGYQMIHMGSARIYIFRVL